MSQYHRPRSESYCTGCGATLRRTGEPGGSEGFAKFFRCGKGPGGRSASSCGANEGSRAGSSGPSTTDSGKCEGAGVWTVAASQIGSVPHWVTNGLRIWPSCSLVALSGGSTTPSISLKPLTNHG